MYYHARGWSVIPANAETKKPCLKSWKRFQTERPTEDELREWFTAKYDAMAIVMGAVSGNLGVLDFDSQERWEWWSQRQPKLARVLPTEKTARGSHVFFRCEPIRTQRPKNQKVELLCEGAYVIVTPSPGRQWITAPNGQLPEIDPFALGLEVFGITRPGADSMDFTEEPEDTEDTEEREAIQMASGSSDSSDSSGSSVNLDSFDTQVRERIEQAITKTLPTGIGQRNRSIFTFCQWLKAVPELGGLPAKALRPVVEKWHARAYPVIGTKPFDDTWADFVYAWRRVKWPKRMLLDMVVRRALEDTHTPPEAADYENPKNRLLVRICWQLQQLHGDEPFHLAQRTAGELLGISHTEAGKRIEMLMADGILAIACAHTNLRATRYRYMVNSM